MRVWYFSEMAYHPAWEEGLKRGSLRVVLPNANYDPKVGHQLLNRYLDEFRLCDEGGLDIIGNEHHSTSTRPGPDRGENGMARRIIGRPAGNGSRQGRAL